jgi:hypothetical protein
VSLVEVVIDIPAYGEAGKPNYLHAEWLDFGITRLRHRPRIPRRFGIRREGRQVGVSV